MPDTHSPTHRRFQDLARAGGALAPCAALAAALWGCGEAPATLDDFETTRWVSQWELLDGYEEPPPTDTVDHDSGEMMFTGSFDESNGPDAPPASRELSAFEAEPEVDTVDKALIFEDPTLSCVSILGLSCPDVTLTGDGTLLLAGRVFERNPAVPDRSGTFTSRRAEINLRTITCDPTQNVGQGIELRDVIGFRVDVETRAAAISQQTVLFDRRVRPRNYPGAEIDRFICSRRQLTVSAPGFRSKRVSVDGRFVGQQMLTDSRTDVDGTGNLQIACSYEITSAQLRVERDRPRDLLSVSGAGFVRAETLSSTERTRRCSAMCQDDCAEQFGADALGAEACVRPCTDQCVSRSIRDLGRCPSTPPACTPCQRASDCGSPSSFECSSGCCVQRIP